MYKLHTPLCILHFLALLLVIGACTFLFMSCNFLTSALVTMETLRKDERFMVTSDDLGNPGSTSAQATSDLRLASVVIGAFCIVATLVVSINIYCFLALMLPKKSSVAGQLPCAKDIRKKLVYEASEEMDIHAH